LARRRVVAMTSPSKCIDGSSDVGLLRYGANKPGKRGILREFSGNSVQSRGKIVANQLASPDAVSEVQNALKYVCGGGVYSAVADYHYYS